MPEARRRAATPTAAAPIELRKLLRDLIIAFPQKRSGYKGCLALQIKYCRPRLKNSKKRTLYFFVKVPVPSSVSHPPVALPFRM